jgi:predicted alpha/beta-fold hydrolase
VSAYYRDASSVDAINAIRIPFLAIQATDDPVGFICQYSRETLPLTEM